jgi:hypothetical protein
LLPLLLISLTVTQLYELEVTTSQGVYYIDRTFEELAELNTVVPKLLPLSFRRGGLAAD